jgi:hypothetical protein
VCSPRARVFGESHSIDIHYRDTEGLSRKPGKGDPRNHTKSHKADSCCSCSFVDRVEIEKEISQVERPGETHP